MIEDDSETGCFFVGRGGIPNSKGVLECDAAVMVGDKCRFGAVAALQGWDYMHLIIMIQIWMVWFSTVEPPGGWGGRMQLEVPGACDHLDHQFFKVWKVSKSNHYYLEPLVSDHLLSATFWVIIYGRFDCMNCTIKEIVEICSLWAAGWREVWATWPKL